MKNDPITYAPHFAPRDWEAFEHWLCEEKNRTTQQAKQISKRERSLLMTSSKLARLVYVEYKSGEHKGRWIKGKRTAVYGSSGGFKGVSLRKVLTKAIGSDYLTTEDRVELFEQLFGDDAESKRKQATSRKIIVSSRLAGKVVWHLSDVEPPTKISQVRSLEARRDMMDELRSKYAGAVNGLYNDCRRDPDHQCEEFHLEHSQFLRAVCAVRSDDDLQAALNESYTLRKSGIVKFRDDRWYDWQSYASTFPTPTDKEKEVEKIAKVASEAKLAELDLDAVERWFAAIPGDYDGDIEAEGAALFKTTKKIIEDAIFTVDLRIARKENKEREEREREEREERRRKVSEERERVRKIAEEIRAAATKLASDYARIARMRDKIEAERVEADRAAKRAEREARAAERTRTRPQRQEQAFKNWMQVLQDPNSEVVRELRKIPNADSAVQAHWVSFEVRNHSCDSEWLFICTFDDDKQFELLSYILSADHIVREHKGNLVGLDANPDDWMNRSDDDE